MGRDDSGFSNLLLVSIEDLNDWIEPLRGHPDALTPNLQRLADRGVVFENAFATTPACSPSRTAALFSREPWKTGVMTNREKWFDHFDRQTDESLVGQLRKGGFRCYGSGKVFHPAGDNPDQDYDAYCNPAKVRYPTISKAVKAGDLGKNADFGIDPTGEPSFDDIHVADAVTQMQTGAEGQVWTVGIFRPHLPFIAPKEFFDRLPAKVSIPPGLRGNTFDANSGLETSGLPKEAAGFVGQFSHDGRGLQKHGEYNAFLRAYLASIAYADDLLGKLLDRLEETGLDENTLVVVWSDHGWQLGEKLAFRKFTLWERSLRIPLMFAGPGISPGRRTGVASLLDLGPTVLDLLGLEVPEAYDGVSLKSAIADPAAADPRDSVISAWTIRRGRFPRSAVSIRNRDFRYIRYWSGGEELYAHPSDPFEKTNLLSADADADAAAAPGNSAPLDSFRSTAEGILSEIASVLATEDRGVAKNAMRIATRAARFAGKRLPKRAEVRRHRASPALARPALKVQETSEGRLPDFICIGAQKAGTSWLAEILAQHPDAWNPGIKEIHYFDRSRDGRVVPKLSQRLLRRAERAEKARQLDLPDGLMANIGKDGLGLDEYAALFSRAPENKLVWEITPSYSAMNGARIDEMLRVLPQAKFIYLVRDPVKRTESSLRMTLERSDRGFGKKRRHDDVARAWLEDDKGVGRGDYADAIPRWDAKLEGSGRLLYLPFGMIKTDPAELIRRIENFLGLAHFDAYAGLMEPHHQTRKIELPAFAVEEIRRRMEPHRAYLRERFGEAFSDLT